MSIKLNLGCGPTRMEGETGVDLYESPTTDVVADITKRLPFEDNSADQVRLDHVLEHLDRSLTYSVLREAYRVLKHDGKIIVGVPDLTQYFQKWIDNPTDLQMKTEILTGIYGGQMAPGEYHKAGFDAHTLQDVLEAAGFVVEYVGHDDGPWRTEGFCIKAEGRKP